MGTSGVITGILLGCLLLGTDTVHVSGAPSTNPPDRGHEMTKRNPVYAGDQSWITKWAAIGDSYSVNMTPKEI